jgi:spore germination cell wall hydrolase CwlJ-like protein
MDRTCSIPLVPPSLWAIMTILHEARNQSLNGMIGVAEVIRNRTEQKFFSDGTVISTVLRDRQFSGWNNQDPNRIICGKLEIDDPLVVMATKAWKIAINNNTELTSGALFYHSKHMDPFPDWSKDPSMEVTTTIEDHIFYRKKS